jgi:phenylacetic acid degradation operon negative regulatory protein
VLSLLLGMERPAMASSDLVRWCALFAVPEGTTRVALSRMVERGELVAAAGRYELAGRVRARQPEQELSLAPRTRPWDGTWVLAVVRDGARAAADRADLRETMRVLRFAELRAGVWTRPDNLDDRDPHADEHATLDAQCTRWSARPADDPADLVARFAPDDWARRARALLTELRTLTADLPHDDALPRAFTAGAETLQHLGRDPLLPAELLAPDHPGDALRAQYRAFRQEFATSVASWFRRTRAE